jgi:hypothetical protein
MKQTRLLMLGAMIAGSALALSGCSASPSEEPDDSASGVLTGLCPDTVKVQLDWEPEADYGGIFAMLGDDYTVDLEAKSVTGNLVDSSGEDTGVDIQIQSGGGAIGYQAVTAQMYVDRDILLGTVSTDQAMSVSDENPVTAVASTATYSPYILFWDPETHPDWDGIADIGGTGATVLAAASTVFPEWLVGEGLIDEEQIDRSYDNGPARFVTDPSVVVEGYATNTPYVYENEVADWNKPVAYELLKDVGYEMYPSALSVRTEDIEGQAECLEKLIPIYQGAYRSYVEEPASVNETIVDLVEQYDTTWTYSAEIADYAHSQFTDLGLIVNEADGSLGGFDMDRMQRNVDDFTPVLSKLGSSVKAGLTPEDIATNQFIDPSIGLK